MQAWSNIGGMQFFDFKEDIRLSKMATKFLNTEILVCMFL